MPPLIEISNDLHPWIPFLALALLLCALLAWLANFRLKALFPQPGRRLLTLFVSIQAFLLMSNYFMVQGSTDFFPEILWNLDEEWTIPSVHSTIQLLLLASLCCMNGFRNRGPGLPERAWWLVLGLAIIGLAMLEFFEFFKFMISGPLIARASGVSLLLTSLLMAWQRRRDGPRRNGLLLFLGGMGMWAFGVFRLDFPIVPATFRPLEETVETLGIAVAIAGATGYAQAS
ncbi:MAG: hypothetical protein OXH77_04495 [Anaerolineaceae bacterium]|nr:hypothetical protein [Anaerolineaceae bacterium]